MSNIDELRTKGDGEPDKTGAVKQELDGLKAKLDEVGSALKGAPTADEVTGIKSQIDAISATVADIPGKYEGLIKSLSDRVDELQTGAALSAAGNANAPEGIKSVSQAILDSDTYKSIFDERGNRAGMVCGNGQWTGKTSIKSYSAALGFKAAVPVTISDMAGGNLTAYRPGISQDPKWAMDLVSRIPSQIIKNATSYAIPKETAISANGAWTSVLTANIDGDPTPKSVASFAEVDGLMVGSTVTFYNASGVALGSSIVVSMSGLDVTFTTNSLDFDATSGWRVASPNYGVTAELGTKPNSWAGTENASFSLKMLATILPTTVNAINTIAGLESFIEQKLPMEARRNLSRHLLYGDDGAKQLQGFRTYTGAQTYNWSDGVSGDNQVDAIMRAANLIPWTAQLGVVMNQADLPALYLLKGGDGHYLRTGSFGMVPLTGSGGSWYLGPHELVFDYSTTSGDFTVVNFSEASELADQDTASLMWGYVDDDFETNVIRARYEQTVAHAIRSTVAYVVGEWDSAP